MEKLNRIGEKHITNEGYLIKIIEYTNIHNCSIKFENGIILNNIQYRVVKTGQIKNRFHPSMYGKGYLGLGNYKTSINGKRTKCYIMWKNMLQRCYSENYHLRTPTYKDCEVCEEWLNFQNFAKWFEENYIEGYVLDKDLLSKGNKIYSPETCCFIPPEINSIIAGYTNRNKDLPLGVQKCKKSKKYTASLTLNYKSIYCGGYETIEEAFNKVIEFKNSHIENILIQHKNNLSEEIFNTIKNYTIDGK